MLFLIISVFAVFYWVYYTAVAKALSHPWETLPTKEQYRRRTRGHDGDIIFCIHCAIISNWMSACGPDRFRRPISAPLQEAIYRERSDI